MNFNLTKVKSNVTGIEYDPRKMVRIVNIIQASAYIQYGVPIVDIYLSADIETRRPILVFLFDRRESQEAYGLWCRHELDYEIREHETDKTGN